MKNEDLVDPMTTFIWDAIQRECKENENVVD